MRKIIEKILFFLARLIVKKYKPFIIGITGSVGKTSTKEAIALVLKEKFFIRASYKNYNNEIGLPLTIIGEKSPGKSFLGWLKVFLKGIFGIIFPIRFPKILVLEMAADKPKDIEYLTKIAPPKIGVLTAIAPVHLEKFKTIENIAKEKEKIVTCLPPDGLAILNADYKKIREIKDKIKAKVLFYGFSKRADLRVVEAKINQEIDNKGRLNLNGLTFKLSYQGNVVPFFLPKVFAKHHVYSFLPAIAIGSHFGLNLVEISEILKEFKPPPGRMNLINGIKESLIIDDTYNSSPEAVISAFKTLEEILTLPGRRKIVVLSDMLELGKDSEKIHFEIGKKFSQFNFNLLITVGDLAEKIALGAKESGFPEDLIFQFKNLKEASKFLKEKIIYGDIILVKGSQGMRMEKIVKEIMAEPEKAKDLLVRQEKDWEDKP